MATFRIPPKKKTKKNERSFCDKSWGNWSYKTSGSVSKKAIRFLHHMNVKSISSSTFENHQKYYLHPAVCDVWNKFQNRYLWQALEGRADTPGHSAKFGSYGILDLDLIMVVDIQLVQVNLFKLLVCSRTFIAQWKTFSKCLKKKHFHSHITHFQNISAEIHYPCKSSKTF
jgi:solute carrier family 8 (sodium/calcium exchanger)